MISLQVGFNILFSFCIYLLIVQGFSVLYQVYKFFNLSLAAYIALGSYLSYFFIIQHELSIWVAIPIATIFTILIGLFFEIALFKKLRKRYSSPMALMIASLGLYIVLQNVISILWGDNTQSLRDANIKVGHNLGGAYITEIQIYSMIIAIFIFIASILVLKYTRIGRNIRAIASNSELSNIIGINSEYIMLYVSIISIGLVTIAGIIITYDVDMTPTMGFSWLLYAIVAMIIGGIGSNWGLIGGALLLATSQHLVAYYIGTQWTDAVAYIILIIFLLWKPLGFSGKLLKKVEI